MTGSNYDFAIVGGGLHGCVIALALAAARPTARVVLIERDAELAGNHTWCLHADDVPAELADVIAPAIAHRWDGYRVAFVDHERALASPYVAVTSASLARTVRDACARSSLEVCTGLAVRRLNARRVVLADGRAIDATTVIDARGPDRYAIAGAPHGYQKFVGLELALARPHGLTTPMLMDARVPQSDGFRFFYVLPLAPDRVLVEDTYYSDDATLDRDALTANVHAYADAHGFAIDRVIRREAGVLPLPLASTFDAARAMPVADHPLAVGYHAGWFHPTTGYSFPLALRVAALIANAGADASAAWATATRAHTTQLAFATRLNRMLFRWFAPADRHHVLSRFYRLPEPVIRRFYALRTTRLDRARVFVGRPPKGLSWRSALTNRKAA